MHSVERNITGHRVPVGSARVAETDVRLVPLLRISVCKPLIIGFAADDIKRGSEQPRKPRHNVASRTGTVSSCRTPPSLRRSPPQRPKGVRLTGEATALGKQGPDPLVDSEWGVVGAH